MKLSVTVQPLFWHIESDMMTTELMQTAERNDAELVAASLNGDREAFRHIVERYQTLICSLAYSATGNVSQSEDVAQETFLTAWTQLRALREPDKLRAWLSGIARNKTQRSLREGGREPTYLAAPLEDAQDPPADQALPSEQAITREEEAILWRSLERIPETYREPLVLYYREHQSIERVAAALELTEDTVKQRLSRGRKLLQEEVQAFVKTRCVGPRLGKRSPVRWWPCCPWRQPRRPPLLGWVRAPKAWRSQNRVSWPACCRP